MFPAAILKIHLYPFLLLGKQSTVVLCYGIIMVNIMYVLFYDIIMVRHNFYELAHDNLMVRYYTCIAMFWYYYGYR